MARILASLSAGLVFGLGLAVSQMVNPAKVLAFLDVAGAWDPSLALVMGAAVAVTWVGYRLVLGRPKPVLTESFQLPTKTAIDARLITGAAIFGIGWGLAGLCPGPAIASAAYLQAETLYFVPAMLAGLFLARRIA
ncbi:MAG: YeeE/YedE family protein [Alphaproteobacteria bacterium]|nr:YeeE/YedE family protein [Alphaproteobacteria bacterium]